MGCCGSAEEPPKQMTKEKKQENLEKMTVPEPEVHTPTPVKETPIDLSSDEETEEPIKDEDID